MFTSHHVSHVTCQMLGVRCQVLGVRCQVSLFFLTKWWSYYQLGLSGLISSHFQKYPALYSYPSHLQKLPVSYSHLQPFQPFPAIYSNLQPFQPFNVQLFTAIYSQYQQYFTSIYSHLQPIPASSSLFQPSRA